MVARAPVVEVSGYKLPPAVVAAVDDLDVTAAAAAAAAAALAVAPLLRQRCAVD